MMGGPGWSIYLGVRSPELEFRPHRVDVSLAQHDQGSSALLHRLDDLVGDHLANLNVNILKTNQNV